MADSTNKKKDAVYFAYGTLLHVDHMRTYCPSADPVGIMRLKGYRLGFARCRKDPAVGGCTLQEDPGNTMFGILYSLPAAELALLDQASGVDKQHWVTQKITLVDEQGRAIAANTYVIPDPDWNYTPTEDYTRRIMVGARAWSLSADYVAQLEAIIRGVPGRG
jgi:gamma-glutamylcyclotransferase